MFLYISTDFDKVFHYGKTETLQQNDDLLRFIESLFSDRYQRVLLIG